METLQRFHEVVSKRHEYAREWKKKTGGKVIGYFSCYVPEEIIYAAGGLPVRITGASRGLDAGLAYLDPSWCAFSRGCLAEAVQGRYDYLDGIVLGHECMHYQAVFHSWRAHLPVSYSYEIYIPRYIQSPHAKDCIRGEIAYFKRSLEEWIMRNITDQTLDDAIDVYNVNWHLFQELYNLMKLNNPPISGAEIMEVSLASMFMDKEEHNTLLQQLLKEASQLRGRDEPGKRLMIVGPEFDDVEFVRLVESLGSRIVADDLETGSRYLESALIPDRDRLSAIANRLTNRTPCPTKDYPERRRFRRVLRLVRDFQVQGVILLHRKFCDPYAYDLVPLQSLLKENNIPSLVIDFATTIPERKFRPILEDFLGKIKLREENNAEISV